MGSRIFLAGAAGAIGRRLAPLLRDAGHQVVGTTRSSAKVPHLLALGVEPVVVDVFDAAALLRAVGAARAEIVINQLTDLPSGLETGLMAEAIPRNARVRDEGSRNLVVAALAARAVHLVAQSIAWAYAPGPLPHAEDDPLDTRAEGDRAISIGGVVALEGWTLGAAPLTGVVLRYGQLYGPGTGREHTAGPISLHVDAAAHAALLAVDHRTSSVFNVAEANEQVSTAKAHQELGWRPDFRLARSVESAS